MGNDFWMFQGTDYLQATAHTLIGDITFSCEFVAEDCTNKQYIYSNTKFEVYVQTDTLRVTSNGSTIAKSGTLADDTHYSVIINRNYDGETNIYLNGVISGIANQASGTPASGITHTIGQDFYGLIGKVRINQTLFDSVTVALCYDGHSQTNWKELYYAYGAEWDVRRSNPSVLRVGYLPLHASLPVQSNMKGCLVADDGTVNYYLKADDWTKKADGNASDLSGADGQVMVEVPEYWYRFSEEGYIQRMMISAVEIDGWNHIPKFYMSAYEAAVNRTAPIKMWSIVNTATEYRGGNNTSAWDGAANSLLGKPATYISRTNFRTYANNRGTKWTLATAEMHSALTWLFVVEYATRNSQEAVNAVLTAEGYHQGGLGAGVTTVVSTTWTTFNGQNPFVPCGSSNSLANGTGEVDYVATDFGGVGVDQTFKVPRYRGVENPFGHIWKWLDGINILHNNAGDGGTSLLYQRTTKAFVDGTLTNYTAAGNLPTSNGYVKLMQDSGLIMSKTVGAGETTWWCDYFYTPQPVVSSAWYAPTVGGEAYDGASPGLGYVRSNSRASGSAVRIGSRLCCFGE
jgi:hypothetical protein